MYIKVLKLFQFYKVRLKVATVTGYGLTSWFQFYKVRLKDVPDDAYPVFDMFQFYKVRLKVDTVDSVFNYKLVSIL